MLNFHAASSSTTQRNEKLYTGVGTLIARAHLVWMMVERRRGKEKVNARAKRAQLVKMPRPRLTV